MGDVTPIWSRDLKRLESVLAELKRNRMPPKDCQAFFYSADGLSTTTRVEYPPPREYIRPLKTSVHSFMSDEDPHSYNPSHHPVRAYDLTGYTTGWRGQFAARYEERQ